MRPTTYDKRAHITLKVIIAEFNQKLPAIILCFHIMTSIDLSFIKCPLRTATKPSTLVNRNITQIKPTDVWINSFISPSTMPDWLMSGSSHSYSYLLCWDVMSACLLSLWMQVFEKHVFFDLNSKLSTQHSYIWSVELMYVQTGVVTKWDTEQYPKRMELTYQNNQLLQDESK